VSEALDLALGLLEPGSDEVHRRVSEFFVARGYPTVDRHDDDEPLREGFFHSLGHGVGLEVHEKPSLGRRSDPLQVGDVVAIEPGLYLKGVGGVRLEDTMLIGEDGPIRFTDPFPYGLEP
jgi:Xaa-Pro aminopeptidase